MFQARPWMPWQPYAPRFTKRAVGGLSRWIEQSTWRLQQSSDRNFIDIWKHVCPYVANPSWGKVGICLGGYRSVSDRVPSFDGILSTECKLHASVRVWVRFRSVKHYRRCPWDAALWWSFTLCVCVSVCVCVCVVGKLSSAPLSSHGCILCLF